MTRLHKFVAWSKTGRRPLIVGLLSLFVAALLVVVTVVIEEHATTVRVAVPLAAAASAPALPKLVATYRDRAPDMVVYTKDRHSGPLRYVLEEAASRIGYEVEWKSVNFNKSLVGLVDGSVDVVPYVFAKTPEREKEARFSVSLGLRQRPVYLAMQKSSPVVIKTIDDLAGHKVGHLKSGYYFAELHTTTTFKPVPYADDRSLVKGFVDGEVDIMAVSDKQTSDRALADMGYNDYKYADLIFKKESDMYFIYTRSPERQKIFDQLDKALVQMRNEGLIADVYNSFDADAPK